MQRVPHTWPHRNTCAATSSAAFRLRLLSRALPPTLVLVVLRSELNPECNSPSLFLLLFAGLYIYVSWTSVCIYDAVLCFIHYVKSKIRIKIRNKLYVLSGVWKKGPINDVVSWRIGMYIRVSIYTHQSVPQKAWGWKEAKRGRRGGRYRLCSRPIDPKSSVGGMCGWCITGETPRRQLEQRGWSWRGQHGGMLSGMQMRTYQAYWHHSKSYPHGLYAWGGLNERQDVCWVHGKVRTKGKG